MKLNKKILGFSIAGLAVAAATPALAITLSSCRSPKVTDFYNALNDPYKELNMFATTMDAANLVAQPQSNGNNQASPSTKDQTQSTSFESKAQKINKDMKAFVQKLANISAIKTLRDNNATVLFLKNPTLSNGSGNDLTNDTKEKVKYFQIEQPILYSQVYSTPEVEECPGFGFKFPTPRNNSANALFDDWFEIGASAQEDKPNTKVSTKLTDAWSGTADYVFYLYDSKNFTPEAQQKLVDYIYNNNDPKFLPNKLLKSNAIVKHVIPLDMEWMYNGIWDQIGSFTIDYLLAMIFANTTQDGNIQKFYNLNFDNVNNDGQLKNGNQTKGSKEVLDAVNQYISTDSNTAFTPTRATKTLQRARPKTTEKDSENINFVTTMFNTTGHALSFGIAPDYTIKHAKSVVQHSEISAYLEPYMNIKGTKNNTNASQPETSIQENVSDGPGFIDKLQKLQTYALADNQDSFGDKVAPWPLQNVEQPKPETPSTNGPQLFHEDIGTTGDVVTKAKIKAVYTQRNDNRFTQYTSTNPGETFDLPLWNSKTNQPITLSTWLKEQ